MIYKIKDCWECTQSFELDIYDIIVFEGPDGYIYQDSICSIEEPNIYGVSTIHCNNTTLYIHEYNNLAFYIEDNSIHMRGKIREIWNRVDKDTFKKVYDSKEDN